MDFMDKVLRDKRSRNAPKGTKYTIEHDKWDMEDWGAILDEMKELSVADDRLTDFTPTGHEAMADTFFSLIKAEPELTDPRTIRPSWMVNYAVMNEAMHIKEYEQLRLYSSSDEIASGLACITMEPELETLFDKLKDEQDMAKKLEEQLQGMEGMEGEISSVEEMMEQAMADGDEQQAQDYQDQLAKMEEQLEQMRQQVEQGIEKLENALQEKGQEIRDHVKEAAEKAKDQAEGMENLSSTWGLGPGSLKRLPPERRILLAQRVNNPRFKKIADLIGPMQRIAMAEQSRKVVHAVDEIYDLEMGNDLPYLIPEELLYLEDPTLALDFYMRYYDHRLLQFKLKGTEKVARGGIIYLEDGSSSMSGDREVWAKAVGLALLHVARSQKRDFYGVHFGSTNVYKNFDFDTTNNVVTTSYKGVENKLDMIDGIIEFAETFFASGTCFMTPLSQAMDKLNQEFEDHGAVRGDVVFATDGQCAIPPVFMEKLKAEQEKLGFRIFGVILGNEPQSEPLNTICDGRVWTIKDLLGGGDMRGIFRDV